LEIEQYRASSSSIRSPGPLPAISRGTATGPNRIEDRRPSSAPWRLELPDGNLWQLVPGQAVQALWETASPAPFGNVSVPARRHPAPGRRMRDPNPLCIIFGLILATAHARPYACGHLCPNGDVLFIEVNKPGSKAAAYWNLTRRPFYENPTSFRCVACARTSHQLDFVPRPGPKRGFRIQRLTNDVLCTLRRVVCGWINGAPGPGQSSSPIAPT
jgi:hypothetical protein